MKISAKVCKLYRRQVSKLRIIMGHNFFKEYKGLYFFFVAHHRIMHDICTKFHENTYDSFNVIEWRRFPYKSG